MNARDQLRPKSIRVAILSALADGAITTIDDLQIKLDEPRKKVVDNAIHAFNDGLIKRMRDEVTNAAAYQITPRGREFFDKYQSGKVEAPADVADEEKPVITPGVKVEIPLEDEHKKAVIAWEKAMMAAVGEDLPDEAVKAIERIRSEVKTEIARLNEHQKSNKDLVTRLSKEILEWISMAKVFECSTPGEVADRMTLLEPVGYVMQCTGKPIVRFTKANSAEARAMASARAGKRAQVFALNLVGTAVPGAEWKRA